MKTRLHNILVLLLLLFPVQIWAEEYREVTWEELMPEGWLPPEPAEPIDHNALNDFLAKEGAPIVPELNDQKLKIPGYVIPLKFKDNSVTEFLLVPFVGACIHVPPPPENQMVYVVLKTPLTSDSLWEPVWVSGVMKTKASLTEYATAGYSMVEASTETYVYCPRAELANFTVLSHTHLYFFGQLIYFKKSGNGHAKTIPAVRSLAPKQLLFGRNSDRGNGRVRALLFKLRPP